MIDEQDVTTSILLAGSIPVALKLVETGETSDDPWLQGIPVLGIIELTSHPIPDHNTMAPEGLLGVERSPEIKIISDIQ